VFRQTLGNTTSSWMALYWILGRSGVWEAAFALLFPKWEVYAIIYAVGFVTLFAGLATLCGN
jgi:hypothetical protein